MCRIFYREAQLWLLPWQIHLWQGCVAEPFCLSVQRWGWKYKAMPMSLIYILNSKEKKKKGWVCRSVGNVTLKLLLWRRWCFWFLTPMALLNLPPAVRMRSKVIPGHLQVWVSPARVGCGAAALGSVSCCQCCVVFVGWVQRVSFSVGLSFPFSETSKVRMAWEVLFIPYSEEFIKAVQRVTSLVCWRYPSLNSMSFLKSTGLSVPPLLGVGHGAMHRGCLKSPKTFFNCFVMCHL